MTYRREASMWKPLQAAPKASQVREIRAQEQMPYCALVRDDARKVRVQKKSSRVMVRFLWQPETITTREGPVMATPGDVVVTAATGEQWPVARAAFEQRYRPTGQPGEYASTPRESLALAMNEPFAVILADGVSRLSGRAGDWLLDHGDGNLGIVAADIFSTTYERLD